MQNSSKIIIREIIDDVQKLHINESNNGALFQIASQFNLLEMASPNITPEQGINDYEHDRTQGPHGNYQEKSFKTIRH